MEYKTKGKDKANARLKEAYPIFAHVVDEKYNDWDWQEVEYDEITGKKIVMTLAQYEYELENHLKELSISGEKIKLEQEEANILNCLHDMPIGVYGD